MISVQTAAQIIQKYWLKPESESIPLEQCHGKILAEPIYADRDYPPIHRVMMDGIAICKKSYDRGQRKFPIVGLATAGRAPLKLQNPETCIEVMTGCALPDGTDLIIPYELLHISQGIAEIKDDTNIGTNYFVHRKGSDCDAGSLIIPPGIKLQGIHVGILASFGYTQIAVEKPVKIKIITTGDELISIDQKPQPYELRRSNSYALRAALLSYGYPQVDTDHIPDDPEMISSHYEENTSFYDVLIYSGGVSQGKRDYLPQVWQKMGVIEYIQGVKQKPGKPMRFGIDPQTKTIVWGLPGNPISGLVCLHRYLLNRLTFASNLRGNIPSPADLTYFVPVKINSKLEASPVIPKNSGDFTALVNTDGFIELPPQNQQVDSSESYRFYPWY